MAQTSNAIQPGNYKIEISEDGVTWTDISGYANNIALSGGARASGETYTYDGDTAILGVGKREPVEATVSVVYTEAGTPPTETIRTWNENATQAYMRYSPAGGSSGDFQYTGQGYFLSPILPNNEANSNTPIPIEFTFRTPEFVKSVVA